MRDESTEKQVEEVTLWKTVKELIKFLKDVLWCILLFSIIFHINMATITLPILQRFLN